MFKAIYHIATKWNCSVRKATQWIWTMEMHSLILIRSDFLRFLFCLSLIYTNKIQFPSNRADTNYAESTLRVQARKSKLDKILQSKILIDSFTKKKHKKFFLLISFDLTWIVVVGISSASILIVQVFHSS